MRVLRDRAETIAADRERTDEMVSCAADAGEPALRVWAPHRQVAFGRRDARTEGYDAARAAAQRRGYPAVERDVGGRAVAFTGTTLSVVYADPDADRTAVQSRYDDATDRLRTALAGLGVEAREGEPPDSFCPGSHSLRADGKIAGLAQRVRRDVAVTAAVAIVTGRDAVATALAAVYDALGIPFDPDSVGSVACAGGPTDPATVGDAIVDAFVD